MGIAEDLIRLAQAGIDDGLAKAAKMFAETAQHNMPVGDPSDDPSPDIALRENINITADGDGVVISVDTEYAAKQEFDLRLKHPRGGGPRYLQRALASTVPTLDGIIASDVEARFAAGLPKQVP
jgi:hypothetical protein